MHTLNFELNRSLSKGKNKKVIGLMKDELDGQIMKKIVGLRAKTYSYLKKQEPQKMRHIKKTNFQDYKTYLEVAQIENKINHLEKR